jgi:hypothetical protein
MINEKLSDQIAFVGFIDDKADLLEYRKIKKVYHIPVERQESLNVQIALMTSVAKNWKDVFGSVKHINYSSDDYDVVFIEVMSSTLVIMAAPGKGPQIAKQVFEIIAEMS